MEATINITYPVLVSPEKFVVRYRLLPDGDWIDFGDVTSNSFTLTGLVVGQYEVEITFITADDVECTPTVIVITIEDVPACTCGSLEDVYVRRNCDQTATIYATFDDNFDSVCEYRLTYTQFGGLGPNTITYTENPGTVAIPIAYSSSSVPPNLSLIIVCCDGQEIGCFDSPIYDIRDCVCVTSPSITAESIQYDPATEQYSIQFNLSPGSPAPAPPYQVEYYQLNTIDPTTPIIVDEGSDGFKSYDVTIEPHTGAIMFRVKLTTACGTAQKDLLLVTCGTSVAYNGGQSFPTETAIYVGPDIGVVQVNYNALTIPDKFVMEFESLEVASSGYRGSTSYQPALDTALADMSLPPELITSPGTGTISFYKGTSTEWVIVKVYAPLNGTAWNYNIICQLTPNPNP